LAIRRSDRRHRWVIPTNPSVSHKPTPASSSASKPPASAIGSRYDIVVCAGTHTALRTTHVVGGVSPRLTSLGARDGGGSIEAGHHRYVVLVLCLAVRIIVWASSHGLDVTGARTVAERAEHQRAYI